ncbi:MAG TPA: TetR/AcrR family transcriptional regulator, partial [Sphingobium sp.]|nr:TetR/AcrR family transcriptional regulator [Sphingobium sp.]
MVQRRKEEVRDAILTAAFELFAAKGYTDTTLPSIARSAKVSHANIYVYFASKLEILFAIYIPWLHQRLDALDARLRAIPDRRERLRTLILALWRDLPKEDNGFAHNIVEAVSSSGNRNDYDPTLRQYFVEKVSKWVSESTDLGDRDCDHVATTLVMAFDGFAANTSLEHGMECSDALVDFHCDLLSV